MIKYGGQQVKTSVPGVGAEATQVLRAKLIAWSSGAFTRRQLQRLRTELRLPNGETLPAAFVRHAEEQTIAGLAATLQTWSEMSQSLPEAQNWGVIAAPEYFGREATWSALQRYSQEGASAISPHLIPNHCLHSLAGSLSVLLGCRGPNYGIGGGPRQFVELLLAGLGEVQRDLAPGYWLVATAWRPAPPELSASGFDEPICLALALAICREDFPLVTWRARLSWYSWPRLFDSASSDESVLGLDNFVRALYGARITSPTKEHAETISWYIPRTGLLELRREEVAVSGQNETDYQEVAA
ncbi:MAG: hypothetical protein RMJ19_12975 [Gemmatales bacterium]|nr:hypothetical protein [Gemmatales bacterium]MCS7161378.1 hypothetical protein [Gemmatales bacterium]MDW8176581.1 hypothetical protein [Gemmatales bacterium]MDW8223781.1 hypothetical protein [Gemmatales bacterium]